MAARRSIWVLWLVLALAFGGASSLLAYGAYWDYAHSRNHDEADYGFARAARSGDFRRYDDGSSRIATQTREAMALGGASVVGFAVAGLAILLMIRARR